MHRRNVAAYPTNKRLIEVRDEKDAPMPFGTKPNDLSVRVLFRILESEQGDRFWAKQYIGPRAEQVIATESLIYERVRHLPYRFSPPVELHPEFGLIFPFEPDLFANKAVHAQDWGKFFSPEQVDFIRTLAETEIELPGLPPGRLIDLTDFQAIYSCEGLKFIDFTPRGWVTKGDPSSWTPPNLDDLETLSAAKVAANAAKIQDREVLSIDENAESNGVPPATATAGIVEIPPGNKQRWLTFVKSKVPVRVKVKLRQWLHNGK